MSRPRLDEKNRRIVQVNIRITTEENIQLNQNATASGLSPANWIRYKIFIGKNPPARVSPLDVSIYSELKKIGVNLNQVAHKLNQGDFPKDLHTTQRDLLILLKHILKTLLDDR